MKKYTAVDGAQFTDADLERWAEEVGIARPFCASMLLGVPHSTRPPDCGAPPPPRSSGS